MSDATQDDVLLAVKTTCFRFLSIRPRSEKELRKKLNEKKYPAEAIDTVIDLFKKQGLINDEKFAQSYATSQSHSRPVGRRQIERQLKQKGVSDEGISRAIQSLTDYDEKAEAKKLVQLRFSKMTGVSQKTKKARLYSFLMRRGFGPDVIFPVMNDLFKDFDDNQ